MNASKALVLGAVAGFLISLVGGCSGTPKCSPSNCPPSGVGGVTGCCDTTQNKCILSPGQTAAQCGASGNACGACTAGNTCNAGVCTTGGQDAGTCTGCPNGCCLGTSCISSFSLSNTNCGANNQNCQACTGNTSCQLVTNGGACVASNDAGVAVGGPCTTNTDCAGLGAGGTCLTTTSTGVVYQSGFCTLDCSVASCPTNSTCVGSGGQFGEITFPNGFCWANCGQGVTCREPGYACYGLLLQDGGQAPTGGCWIDPPAPNGLVGSACTSDQNCFTPTGPGQVPGSCFQSVTDAGCPDGGPLCPSGFVGGYCVADCFNWRSAGQAQGNEYCGDGGVCLGFTGGAEICFQKCANVGVQDVCRTGYLCNAIPLPFGAPGRCFPDCRNVGSTCANGMTCDAGICS